MTCETKACASHCYRNEASGDEARSSHSTLPTRMFRSTLSINWSLRAMSEMVDPTQ
jgi:hypothetical protein